MALPRRFPGIAVRVAKGQGSHPGVLRRGPQVIVAYPLALQNRGDVADTGFKGQGLADVKLSLVKAL